MQREQVKSITSFAITVLEGVARDTENPHDDTLCRYLRFAESDPSYERALDKLFGPQTAPLTAEGEIPQSIEEAAIEELNMAQIRFRRAEGEAPSAEADAANAEQLTAGEWIKEGLPILLAVFALLRKARESKPATG